MLLSFLCEIGNQGEIGFQSQARYRRHGSSGNQVWRFCLLCPACGLWVTYKAQDAKTSRLGPLKRKVKGQKACLQLHCTELEVTGL
jgi:hypothetical protein